ncbi:MAG: antitoxin MazE [Planctomycetota bacterium]|jgi:antitoxin MazE|nr:antitoxin MazE [Planctomycetota bacterium]
MKINIITIGNSKGIRIPKAILKQCHLDKEAELETEEDKIIIKPFKKKPRKGWKEAFSSMRKREEDTLLIDDSIDREMKDWEW